MSGNENRRVFTYQTRVSVTPEQDKMLREYAVRFGRVERTLYREMQKGADAKRLKSDYLLRFAITARQFNAVRILLQGKIDENCFPYKSSTCEPRSAKPRRS